MKTVYFRNIFLDSEINAIGNGQISRIQFPSTVFNIKPTQMMKLVLTSFEMRRNWYSVNSYCNQFFLYNPTANTYTPLVIAPGSYRAFEGTDSLAEAIKDALDIAVPPPAPAVNKVEWDTVSRKFTLTCPGAPTDSYFVCFQVKQSPNNPDPTNISPTAYFNDVAEILGAKPTRDGWTTPVNAFGTSTGTAEHTSPYVGALNVIETIFLRTSLQTNNYQSPSFELNLPNTNSGLVPTNIFARIPLSRAHYDDTFEIIQYEDHNDNFTILLQQTQINDMIFTITDHAGRPLAQVSQAQAQDGNLSFKLSFRWEIVEQEVPQGEFRIREPPLQNMKIVP